MFLLPLMKAGRGLSFVKTCENNENRKKCQILPKILTSFDALKITTKAQQGVLTQLKKRIDGVQLQMNKVENQDLVGKMKALIALEQERYFELEKAKLDLETAQFEAKKKSEASPVESNYITFGAEPK